MGQRIRIIAGDVSLLAELNDSSTAAAISSVLPMRGAGNGWGGELYFTAPIDYELEAGARAELEVGELAFWPPGSAFCIFFGRTPASVDDQPRATSPVNPVGRILDNTAPLLAIPDGTEIIVARETDPSVDDVIV
jgi:uncharacterized protein